MPIPVCVSSPPVLPVAPPALTMRPASLLCRFMRKRRSRPFSLESTNSLPKRRPKSMLSLQPPQCQSGPPGPRRR